MHTCTLPHNPLVHKQESFKQVFGSSTKFKTRPKFSNNHKDRDMFYNLERVDALQNTLRGNMDNLMRTDGPHKRII